GDDDVAEVGDVLAVVGVPFHVVPCGLEIAEAVDPDLELDVRAAGADQAAGHAERPCLPPRALAHVDLPLAQDGDHVVDLAELGGEMPARNEHDEPSFRGASVVPGPASAAPCSPSRSGSLPRASSDRIGFATPSVDLAGKPPLQRPE